MNVSYPPTRTPLGKYVWYARFVFTRLLLGLINLVNYTDEAAVLLERRDRDGGGAYFGTGTGLPALIIDETLQQMAADDMKFPNTTT